MRRFRSFRESFRRKKDKITGADGDGRNRNSSSNGSVNQWHSDEIAVRQGSCTFPIKYLGCVEVFESRGMPICEEALKVLRSTKRKAIRGTLFVSGDGLRVVDGETRGLIVDQTIEKVSFCAPDRNNERGFAYICRDGTTRRWMCHGFHATGNTGERLSHAVGCAFAICLERKQKRDRETATLAASAAAAAAAITSTRHHQQQLAVLNHSTNLQNGNNINMPQGRNTNALNQNLFHNNNHAANIIRDPQIFRSSEPPPMKPVVNPYAIDRPHATPLMLQRQTSFRTLSHLRSQTPFKRQLSLKLQQFQRTTSLADPVAANQPEPLPKPGQSIDRTTAQQLTPGDTNDLTNQTSKVTLETQSVV